MYYRLAAALLMVCGFTSAFRGLAQQAVPQQPAPARGGIRAWCEQHRADCDQLRSQREQAEQTCNAQGKDSQACQQAREAVHQIIDKLRAEGAPAPPAGAGRRMPVPAGAPTTGTPSG